MDVVCSSLYCTCTYFLGGLKPSQYSGTSAIELYLGTALSKSRSAVHYPSRTSIHSYRAVSLQLVFLISPSLFQQCGIVLSLIAMSGDIELNPRPASSTKHHQDLSSIKSIVLNARSLMSWHKTDVGTVTNLERFQELVYANDTDVVCVNETWLHKDILNSELLHDGYAIYRKDRDARRAGGVLIAVKTNSFKSVKQFTPPIGTENLEIVSAELTSISDHPKRLPSSRITVSSTLSITLTSKPPTKSRRREFDYARGDFKGLRASLSTTNLFLNHKT